MERDSLLNTTLITNHTDATVVDIIDGYVDFLIANKYVGFENELKPHSERIEEVAAVLDHYDEELLSVKLPPYLISKMANFILQENSFGSQADESDNKILSKHQMKRRQQKEVSLINAVDYDDTGVNQIPPTRTQRIKDNTARLIIDLG